MLRNRVIPMLLIKDHGLVKTTRFEHPRYVGDPINAIRIFNDKEVDELALLDISATPNGRGPNLDLVADIAPECFMPLAYGGGVRSLDDAKQLFALGVEKIILRTAAAEDLGVVSEIAAYAGSSSVTVSIDVGHTRLGRRRLHCPRTDLHDDPRWLEHLQRTIEAGAGEVLVNVVARDGTLSGMDLEVISEAAQVTSVPLVAAGGVGSLEDIRRGIDAGADAIGVGAYFVYHGPRRAVLITYPDYDDLTALLGSRS